MNIHMRTCRQHSYTYFNLNIFVDSAGDRVQDLAYTRQVSPVSHPKPIPIFFTFPALKSCPTLPSWLFALWRAQLSPDKNTQLPVCHVPVTPRLSQTRTELPPILCPAFSLVLTLIQPIWIAPHTSLLFYKTPRKVTGPLLSLQSLRMH